MIDSRHPTRGTTQTYSFEFSSMTAKLDSITDIVRQSAIRGGKKDMSFLGILFAVPQFPSTRTVITVSGFCYIVLVYFYYTALR
jgi:hypothetical protein